MFAAADCRVIKSSRAQIKTARASLLNIKALMADFFLVKYSSCVCGYLP